MKVLIKGKLIDTQYIVSISEVEHWATYWSFSVDMLVGDSIELSDDSREKCEQLREDLAKEWLGDQEYKTIS